MTDHATLVVALEDLGAVLRAAPVPDLAPAIADRLRSDGSSTPARPVRIDSRRRPVFAAIAVVVLVVAALAVAIRPSREAIADLLGIGDTQIRTVARLDLPDDVVVDLGDPAAVDEVGDAAGFDPAVPSVLGDPDATFFRRVDGYPQVTLVWAAAAGESSLPAFPTVGTLLTETLAGEREAPMFVKEVLRTTDVEFTDVGSQDAYWIEGVHVRFGLDEPRRAAGNTLLWMDEGVMYRLETTGDLASALEVANSVG
jgi:hypothetical protein